MQITGPNVPEHATVTDVGIEQLSAISSFKCTVLALEVALREESWGACELLVELGVMKLMMANLYPQGPWGKAIPQWEPRFRELRARAMEARNGKS